MIREPKLLKNNDVVEFVTEIDQMFVDSMPDTRKFIRLALPGEVDGQLPVMAMRIIFQNDQGALFKGLIFPPKGKYTVADLNQLMRISNIVALATSEKDYVNIFNLNSHFFV